MLKDIYLAGGCFWGVQAYFDRMPGVVETNTGYANGLTENPSYEDVCYRNTGHAEAIHVKYDPEKLPLGTLLHQFFKIIDPTSKNRQGNDIGMQYRTGIYYTDPEDLQTAREVMAEAQAVYAEPLAVELLPLENYYPAEEYHQKYLLKNPAGYCHINFDSLSDLKEPEPHYKKPPDETLRARLTEMQYNVTQHDATEPPFSGEFWDYDEPGLYVDIVTGEPLFLSTDKFSSGCGWPSFTRPVSRNAITEQVDRSHGMIRTEVRSRASRSHLGHVFEDGPLEAGGMRYCINSAALRFIPYADLEKEGYAKYKLILGQKTKHKTRNSS